MRNYQKPRKLLVKRIGSALLINRAIEDILKNEEHYSEFCPAYRKIMVRIHRMFPIIDKEARLRLKNIQRKLEFKIVDYQRKLCGC
jgi:hypothetical protein